MNELLIELWIVAMYLGTMMGIVMFLAFVCRVGDLGMMLLGWIDRKIQDLPRR
jgi:hypothetical protein